MWGRKRGSKVLGQSSRQKEKNIQVPEARVWPLGRNESAAEWPEHKAHSSLFPRSSKGHGTGSSTLNACWIKTSWRKCRGSSCRQVKRGLGEARKYECWGWWHWLGAFIGIQNLLDHPYTHTHTLNLTKYHTILTLSNEGPRGAEQDWAHEMSPSTPVWGSSSTP